MRTRHRLNRLAAQVPPVDDADYLIRIGWEDESARYYRIMPNGDRVPIRKSDMPVNIPRRIVVDWTPAGEVMP